MATATSVLRNIRDSIPEVGTLEERAGNLYHQAFLFGSSVRNMTKAESVIFQGEIEKTRLRLREACGEEILEYLANQEAGKEFEGEDLTGLTAPIWRLFGYGRREITLTKDQAFRRLLETQPQESPARDFIADHAAEKAARRDATAAPAGTNPLLDKTLKK